MLPSDTCQGLPAAATVGQMLISIPFFPGLHHGHRVSLQVPPPPGGKGNVLRRPALTSSRAPLHVLSALVAPHDLSHAEHPPRPKDQLPLVLLLHPVALWKQLSQRRRHGGRPRGLPACAEQREPCCCSTRMRICSFSLGLWGLCRLHGRQRANQGRPPWPLLLGWLSARGAVAQQPRGNATPVFPFQSLLHR